MNILSFEICIKIKKKKLKKGEEKSQIFHKQKYWKALQVLKPVSKNVLVGTFKHLQNRQFFYQTYQLTKRAV